MKMSNGTAMPGRSANLAIALVLVGWLLLAWGVLRQLGDPSPMIPRSELEAMRKASLFFMFSGITALVGAVWLSGRSFERARVRAALALALFLAPMFGLFATALVART